MRLTVDIDDELMKEATSFTGLETDREVIEHGLKNLLRMKEKQLEIRKLRGKLHWEGDLDAMRRDD